MNRVLTTCPSCNHRLEIATLKCAECGLEVNHPFSLSKYDLLDGEQMDFLETFLSCEGNLKELQTRRNISYPFAKKKLHDLLKALDLRKEESETFEGQTVPTTGNGIEDVIRNKLIENGGVADYHTYDGTVHRVYLVNNGTRFASDALPGNLTYGFDIFDCVYEAICQNGGKARKGMARGKKVGDDQLDDTTVAGYLATHFFKKKVGETTLDPSFLLFGIMEWAGIIDNNRGFVELRAPYRCVDQSKEL